jgi:hypothetical protein
MAATLANPLRGANIQQRTGNDMAPQNATIDRAGDAFMPRAQAKLG